MKLTPIGDRIIVRREDKESVTAGGVILPDAARTKQARGEVLAVGPGKWNDDCSARLPMPVKIGDKVLFGKWSGMEHDAAGKEIVILQAGDIDAIIE